MQQIWNITIDDYIEVIELAKSHGKKTGESMEEEFLEIMKKKNCKPLGITELTKEEYINEAVSKNNSVLSIESDSEGTKYKTFKPKNLDKQ